MKQTFQRSFILFYLLGIYVIFQFFWWAYYLIQLHRQVFYLKLEDAQSAAARDLFLEEFNSKLYMVLGEGAVFFVFLVFGLWKLRDYLMREKKMIRLQNNFMLSVTHELKSPIAAIQLHLETLKRHSLKPDQQEKIIARSLEESERLNHLTENILLASRIESDKDFFHFRNFDLSELIEKTANSISESIGINHKLRLDIEQQINIDGDPFALEVLFRNLYENALKYSPEKSEVLVSLREKTQEIELKVADQGEGILDEEKKSVLKKFYRVGREEVRRTKGTGLGLYLVQEIAHLHRARISIKDNEPAGVVFIVIFRKE